MRKSYGVLFAALVICCVAGCVNLGAIKKYRKAPSLPTYDGRIEIPGLNSEVQVYRDQYAIPHIFSEDEHDLFFATGYVQAQDRLWEMVMFRAMATGTVCEMLGDVTLPGFGSTFELDKHQRVLGTKFIGQAAQGIFEELRPDMNALMQAYCDGINAFIESHHEWEQLPVELQILRYRPEPWTVADVQSFLVYETYILSGNATEELLRYGLIKKYNSELGWQLMPLHYSPGPTIVPPELLENKLDTPRDLPPGGRPSDEELGDIPDTLAADHALDFMMAEQNFRKALDIENRLASNNWVVSGKLTQSGNAILANDPHLQHIQPSLTYLMHIKGAGWDVIGATMPGLPTIMFGHTRKLSWGITVSMADTQDLFIETVDPARPGMYKYKGQWKPFTVREEIIRIRTATGLTEKKIEVRQSIHGPIINDIFSRTPKDAPPMALRWVAWDLNRDTEIFELLVQSESAEDFVREAKKRYDPDKYEVMTPLLTFKQWGQGQSIDDFIEGMKKLSVPNESYVAADADGRIAYLPGGLIPIRNKGLGVMPVPGESGEYDWVGFIPQNELPQSIDPQRGYMNTSNNEVVDAELYPHLFSTNYSDGWRGWRVDQLINELAPLSMEDMKRIQNDVYLKRAEWMMPKIMRAIDNKNPTDPLARKAIKEFRAWDFEADLDSTATVIFMQFMIELRRNILEDEMPKKDYQAFLRGRSAGNALNMWLDNGQSPFFDDKSTEDSIEDMDDMIVKSLTDAMAWVENQYGKEASDREWGKVHTMTWRHPLGMGPLKDLNVGGYAHTGTNNTVMMAAATGQGKDPYRCVHGPVLRHLMDMGEPDQALMIIDGSQSGQWLSPHYSDMHKVWADGKYLVMDMDPESVGRNAKYHLILGPAR